MKSFASVLAVAAAAVAWCLLASPASADIKKVCQRFKVSTVDSGIGEDIGPWASALYSAKYARVKIRQRGAGQDIYYNGRHQRGDWETPSNSVTGGRASCEWSPGDHMMHSWEWSSTAYTEGWAQFYATATWNSTSSSSTAMYRYHKTAKEFCDGAGCTTNTPPTTIDMELGGDHLGTCNCFGGSDYSCSGRSSLKKGSGTELDWSRQFWDFYTDAGTPPTWGQLIAMLTVCGPYMDIDTAWESMRDGLQFADSVWGTAFWTRWNGSDGYNGVNYCLTGSNC